jgi:hypothetical protein
MIKKASLYLCTLLALAGLAAAGNGIPWQLYAWSGNMGSAVVDDPVTPTPGAIDPWTPGPVEIFATSAFDDGVVSVEGVDEDGRHFSEEVTVDGGGPATLIQGGDDVIRINRMRFEKAIGGGNSSLITAREPGSVIPRSQIYVGPRIVSEWAVYAVALNRELTIESMTASISVGTGARIELWVRRWHGVTDGSWGPVGKVVVILDGATTSPIVPLGVVVRPGWEIKLVATPTTPSTTQINVSLVGRLRRI